MNQAKDYVGQTVLIGAWVANKRSSGKLLSYNYVMEQLISKELLLKAMFQKKYLKQLNH